VVGAGLSGIGAGYHLQANSPRKTYAILEGRDAIGGTWDLFRYPGIRSDSDMYTLGYSFKPWREAKAIADGPRILNYVRETAETYGIDKHIRYGHQVKRASWSSEDAVWKVEAEVGPDKTPVSLTCGFLFMCSGYYDYAGGYQPDFPGMASFKGPFIHPQHWPKDLDYKGKKVVVIGSGATAVTLVPAMAGDAAHVTMLQRSPTYFIPGQNANELADTLRQLQVDETWIHEIVRRKILYDMDAFTSRCFSEPETVTKELLDAVGLFRPAEQVEKHFTPRYLPWRQRIAFVPDGDLFQGIASGKASVATGEIDCFTEKGIRLTSGEELEADLILTATGFNLNVLGDIAVTVDNRPLVFSDTVTYRGMMFSGVPNLAWVFGYFRASWTLRTDLVADFVCRLLNHMQVTGAKRVEVAPPEMTLSEWIDLENFNPGYITRGQHLLPRSGDQPEWRHSQDYWREKDEFPKIDLDSGTFVYGK